MKNKFTKAEIERILNGETVKNIRLITPKVKVFSHKDLKKVKVGDNEINVSSSKKLMEYVGRVCYNSVDKIGEGSAANFLSKGASDGHRSVFEFSNIECVLKLVEEDKHVENLLFENNYVEFDKKRYIYHNGGGFYTEYKIYGSLRALIELLEETVNNLQFLEFFMQLFHAIFKSEFKIILQNWKGFEYLESIFNDNFLKYKDDYDDELESYLKDILKFTNLKYIPNNKILIEIEVDGKTHTEFVRHRPCSFLAESQRYVRYDDNLPLTLSVPSIWIEDIEFMTDLLNNGLQSYNSYRKTLEGGTAQKARCHLISSVRTKFYIFATYKEIDHIHFLREAKPAHPACKEVMKEVRSQRINKGLV